MTCFSECKPRINDSAGAIYGGIGGGLLCCFVLTYFLSLKVPIIMWVSYMNASMGPEAKKCPLTEPVWSLHEICHNWILNWRIIYIANATQVIFWISSYLEGTWGISKVRKSTMVVYCVHTVLFFHS